MAGRLASWPNWPAFTTDNAEVHDDLQSIKAAIVDRYGEAAITQSWLKVCKALESVTQQIASAGTKAIPEVDYEELFTLSAERKQTLKDAGCMVVRNVFSREQAAEWFASLKAYVSDNEKNINGFPQPKPMMLNLYYSPAQIAARTHPNQLRLARELNSWWHDETQRSSPDPLCYADGLRIRQPGRPFTGFGPHIDAGSLCRWADDKYAEVYAPVFSGHPEQLDIYDLSVRQDAHPALFYGAAQSTIFRAFQGWTALTAAGPGEGSLLLFPHVQWGIAYVMLRPLFRAPADPDDVMDATKWTFDPAAPWFPGTWREKSQLLSIESHPHLRLRDTLVHIPAVEAGDTVWWHADMVHAVDVEHHGAHETGVAYIAATPTTETNKAYMKEQLQDFLNGRPPVDFRRGTSEVGFKGYVGEKANLGGEEGRQAMGYGLLGKA